MATLAIVYAIEHRRRTRTTERVPIRWQVRPVLRGRLGHLMVGVGAFEVGNVAATLLILRGDRAARSRPVPRPRRTAALVLYIAYNTAATLMSVPAGHLGDRHGQIRVLVLGVTLFALAYAGFAVGPDGLVLLGLCFVMAGLAIGCVETAEHAAVAHSAALDLRGSAFGLLAAVQSFGNLAASAIAGILWTAVSPTAAFVYLCAWMLVALVALVTRPRHHAETTAPPQDQ